MPKPFPDITPFVLLHRLADGRGRMRRGAFRCFCGNEFETDIYNVTTKHTKSCGCTAIARTAAANKISKTRHGHSSAGGTRERSPTYKSWQSMIARCTYQPHPAFKKYGGAGITVCERWRVFETFLADMGERPKGQTLDRIKNEKGYDPSNCRWAETAIQMRNRRGQREYFIDGVWLLVRDAFEKFGTGKSHSAYRRFLARTFESRLT